MILKQDNDLAQFKKRRANIKKGEITMIKKYHFVKETLKLGCLEILTILDAIEAYFMWNGICFHDTMFNLLGALFFTGGALCIGCMAYRQLKSIIYTYRVIKRLMDKINI